MSYDWKAIKQQLEQVGERLELAVGPARAVGWQHGILIDFYQILGVLVDDKIDMEKHPPPEALRAAISDEDIAREFWEFGWPEGITAEWRYAPESMKLIIRNQVRGIRAAMKRLGI